MSLRQKELVPETGPELFSCISVEPARAPAEKGPLRFVEPRCQSQSCPQFCHTCTLTSAPLLTRNSKQSAPCVEAAAKCSGVNPLLLGWLMLAPQSISSLATVSWPLKQARWSAVFPNALDSSICGHRDIESYGQFVYAWVCMCVYLPPPPSWADAWSQWSVHWRLLCAGGCTLVCPYSWPQPPDSPTGALHPNDLQGDTNIKCTHKDWHNDKGKKKKKLQDVWWIYSWIKA